MARIPEADPLRTPEQPRRAKPITMEAEPSPYTHFVCQLPAISPPRSNHSDGFGAFQPLSSPGPAGFGFGRGPSSHCDDSLSCAGESTTRIDLYGTGMTPAKSAPGDKSSWLASHHSLYQSPRPQLFLESPSKHASPGPQRQRTSPSRRPAPPLASRHGDSSAPAGPRLASPPPRRSFFAALFDNASRASPLRRESTASTGAPTLFGATPPAARRELSFAGMQRPGGDGAAAAPGSHEPREGGLRAAPGGPPSPARQDASLPSQASVKREGGGEEDEEGDGHRTPRHPAAAPPARPISPGLERLMPGPEPGSRSASDVEGAGPGPEATPAFTPRRAAPAFPPPRAASSDEDEREEAAALVHMALPQSPACVSLARGGRGTAGPALLPITQLRREGSGAEAAAAASLSRHLSAPAPPTERQSRLLDSPAVRAASQAAILEAMGGVRGPGAGRRRGDEGEGMPLGASAPLPCLRSAGRAQRAAAAGVSAVSRAAARAAGIAAAPRRVQAASGRSQGDRCSPDGTADGASEGMGEALSSLFPFPTGARKCNCKKSKCLKLYCDCFAGNGFCGPACTCVSCANREDNRGAVQQQREAILIRNPNAFDQKIAAVDVESGVQHRRGCNCKKSGCIKKYCECFQAGIACGEHCKCEGCKNCVDNPLRAAAGSQKRGRTSGPARQGAESEPGLSGATLDSGSGVDEGLGQAARPGSTGAAPAAAAAGAAPGQQQQQQQHMVMMPMHMLTGDSSRGPGALGQMGLVPMLWPQGTPAPQFFALQQAHQASYAAVMAAQRAQQAALQQRLLDGLAGPQAAPAAAAPGADRACAAGPLAALDTPVAGMLGAGLLGPSPSPGVAMGLPPDFEFGLGGTPRRDGSVAALAADTHLLLDTPLGPEGLLPAPL
ncbi:hypothetical protein ACKKBG_A30265 [Auxenochlorella protothecoides x Auxenochlorella symbiontica]